MKQPNLENYLRLSVLKRMSIPLFLLSIILLLIGLYGSSISVLFYLLLFLTILWLLYDIFLLVFPRKVHGCRRLKAYGDPKEMLHDVFIEINTDCLLDNDPLVLTQKYLVEFHGAFTFIIPLESVLWVYPLQAMRYSFKNHREKMVYSLRIVTIAGDTFVVRNKTKSEIDQIMQVLTEHYPNFFYDYSEEHAEMVHFILDENARELRAKKRSEKQKNKGMADHD